MSDPPENVENNNEKNLLSRFLLNEQCADDGLFLMNQEDREKIFNDMRALDVELGRNYRNVLRAEISKTIETEDIPPRLVYYLDDVPVEELIQFICIQKQDQWVSCLLSHLSDCSLRAKEHLSSRNDSFKKYQQWDVKNWHYCYKNLLKDVLYLYAKHGEMFVRALNQFLTPIYHDFIDDDPFTEDDSTTSFLDYYIGKRDEEEDPYNCEEFFSHCLDCLVGFETSNNCGYFLRVVAPWIAGAKTALDNSRADLYFYDRERMRMQQEQRLVKYKIEEKNGFFHLKRFDSKEERVLMEGCGVKNDDEKDQKQKSELEPDVKKSKQQIVASTTNEVASSFHRFTPFPSKGGFSHYQKRMENILELK
ncbi:Protein CBG07739 [Caenorhabditis briggsae]|uniref:Protein CBG07739 n=3 Tax=Caenorhabditis briggsae TaxID=6238 RepID=A8X468_CAEBR|nr:Protein CBG07739 [Caenorhabditis briggsae]ULT84393.1 hypothetical protein L3Y34_013220 [Caenorhabditis briggsae]CAP27428.2 Protein CBG07739 [Caenorhabditis briggsae]